MLVTVIVLTVLLTASVIANVLLWKAGERQLEAKEIVIKERDDYADWISEWRAQVFQTYAHMKMLDDKDMFSKDDDVGVVFSEMKTLIQSLNDRTAETTEEEGE